MLKSLNERISFKYMKERRVEAAMSHASALKALCPDSGSAQKNVMPFYIKLCILMTFLTIIPILVKTTSRQLGGFCSLSPS